MLFPLRRFSRVSASRLPWADPAVSPGGQARKLWGGVWKSARDVVRQASGPPALSYASLPLCGAMLPFASRAHTPRNPHNSRPQPPAARPQATTFFPRTDRGQRACQALARWVVALAHCLRCGMRLPREELEKARFRPSRSARPPGPRRLGCSARLTRQRTPGWRARADAPRLAPAGGAGAAAGGGPPPGNLHAGARRAPPRPVTLPACRRRARAESEAPPGCPSLTLFIFPDCFTDCRGDYLSERVERRRRAPDGREHQGLPGDDRRASSPPEPPSSEAR